MSNTIELTRFKVASRAKGGNLPGIARFFAAIDSLVSSEEGSLAGN